MWGLEQGLRLWVCQSPVSMRYGIRGLTQMVWSWKGHSPASGDVYVFYVGNKIMLVLTYNILKYKYKSFFITT